MVVYVTLDQKTEDETLSTIRERYPHATMEHREGKHPNCLKVIIPDKEKNTWTMEGDAAFFNDLFEQDYLVGWGIPGYSSDY